MTPSFLRLALTTAAVLVRVAAFAHPSDSGVTQPAFDLTSSRPTAVTQVADDGTIWARGAAWKAHFQPGAVEFSALPACGSAPARARFRLDSARIGSSALALDLTAQPTLEGERVLYDRGALTEVYDLLPGGIEQSFVFFSLPSGGDLSIRIAVEGDLCGRETDAGLLFESDGRTSVRYGDATIRDAAGRELARSSELVGSQIVLRVPQAFLATATFPLVVDPLISTLSVDGGADVCSKPDVAFDVSTSRWLVVYEQAAGDEGDILSRRYDLNGVFQEEVAVNITNDDTIDPAVANNSAGNQFLIVWEKKAGFLSLTQKIQARTRSASSTSQGAIFNVTTTSANEEHPDVGGSPNAGDTKYLVVWDTFLASQFVGADVHGRTVTTSGTLGPILDIGDLNNVFEKFPSVTKSCGSAGVWGIAFQATLAASGDPLTLSPVRLTFVSKAGTVLASNIDADFTGEHRIGREPEIAGDGRVFCAVWEDLNETDTENNVIGSFFAFQNGQISPLAGTHDLTAIEPGAAAARRQRRVAIETDGIRFTYAYREQRANSSDFDIFAATVDPITVAFTEGHVSLSASIFQDDEIELGSTFGSGGALPSRCFAVWTRTPSATDFDVIGALYSQP